MSHKKVTYRIASRRLVSKHRAELARLDAVLCAALGSAYSTEAWTCASFMLELPKKFQISALAFFEDHPVGYWIASIRCDNAHIHRGSIHPEFQSGGIGLRLNRLCADLAREHGASRVTYYISKENVKARRIFEGFGYHLADAAEKRRGLLLMEASL